MRWHESAVVFDCQGNALVGIVTLPRDAPGPSATGVLIVVGGPQYRVGSHRQFVAVARGLASTGRAVMRFDARGMGDAEGETRPFDAQDDDIEAALAAFRRHVPSLSRVVLWGLCDGASAALLYCHRRDVDGVAGLCLLNPWVRSEASLAATRVKHYYIQRLLTAEFWRKLLSGKVARGATSELAASLWRMLRRRGGQDDRSAAAALPYQHQMALAWHSFPGPILLVLSGIDYTAREFEEHVRVDVAWRQALQRPGLRRVDINDADHTFSLPASQAQLMAATLQWMPACE